MDLSLYYISCSWNCAMSTSIKKRQPFGQRRIHVSSGIYLLSKAPLPYYQPFSCLWAWHERSKWSSGAAQWPTVQIVVALGSDQILLCIIPFVYWVQHGSVKVQMSTWIVSKREQLQDFVLFSSFFKFNFSVFFGFKGLIFQVSSIV